MVVGEESMEEVAVVLPQHMKPMVQSFTEDALSMVVVVEELVGIVILITLRAQAGQGD